ncbi:MAG: hypothetical protein OSA04_04810 [Flavobacteriales bacterium]|nr:hypothetical protein [Flavobacteriales bacterium]
MKNIYVLTVVFFLAAGIVGCDTLNRLTQFDMTINSEWVFQSTLNLNLPIDLIVPDIETNSSSTFEGEGTVADLVEDIQLEGLTIQLTSPNSEDFSFLESLEVYIQTEGQIEQRIAFADVISDNVGNTLELDVESVNLTAYVASETFSLRFNSVIDEIVTQDMTIAIAATFMVDAKLL